MTEFPIDQRLYARETALVDAQVLVQKVLNQAHGNPRECEETDPKQTRRLFKVQRKHFAVKMGWSKKKVKRFFADDADIRIKDLGEILRVYGYDLELKEKKRK
jgi:hypothetical protein